MSAPDPRVLRDAFGAYMTGVTVVTARRADGVAVGFTANSFTSVSLDPPLLLVCPGKFLSSYETFASCTHFAVSVLAEGQKDIATVFAS
ncbi:MAG: flavin reductase family protein, partial [Rhizobiaceae bacterium]